MSLFSNVRSIGAKIFHRSQLASDLEEELLSHIQHRADDLERSGISRNEAERRARIEFGARERYREASYQALGGSFFESLLSDARLAVRVLRKAPGFTAVATLTVALAIGANAVSFGIMDALVLRPLNVPQAESLWGTSYGDDSASHSYPNYIDLRERNHTFGDLAAFGFAFVGLDPGNDPSLATGFATSGNYFDVLRIQPFLGRLFHGSDEHGINSAPFVVLSYPYWHSRFHEDGRVVGRIVLLNKHPFTILGVAPRGFPGTLQFVSPDFFAPMVNYDQLGGPQSLTERGNNDGVFEVFGHVKPGISPAEATADLNDISASLQKAYPKEVNYKKFKLIRPGLTAFGGAVDAFVAGLSLLAGLILLAACANLGGLFSAHAADRAREVALRLALGSNRIRILRQLMTEAMLISIAGGALGLVGSVVLLRKLATWQPFSGAPIHVPVQPDVRLLAVAFFLAVVSGLLFGIVPVRQVLRANPYEIVKAGAIGSPGRRATVRDILLVLQIAISAVLVTSSLVAVRGLIRSLHTNLGFEPRNTMLLSANLAIAGYNGDNVLPMQKRLVDAMQSIRGVERVGWVNNYPPLVYASAGRTDIFKDETRDLNHSNVASMPFRYQVSPGYFDAAATSLLTGRDFSWNDGKDAPPVAVANREFARTLFGSVTNAVGKYFRMHDGTQVQIVGVVEDGKYLSLTEGHEPAVFLSALQYPVNSAYVVVRSQRDPQELGIAMRNKLHEVDPGLPSDIETWNSLLSVAMFPARVATMALGALGVMGAILSITGIFAMASYSVSKRMRELGIRVALGARRSEVLGSALGRALRMLAIGSAAGLVLGILASRLLAFIVYQATPRDPVVLAGVIAAMLLLGLLATWIPAQRALSVDPLILLREE